jgi:hypothetical protein
MAVMRLRIGLVLLALAAAAAGIAAATGGRSGIRTGQAGVTLVLPGGWHRIPLALPPARDASDPVTRIVASSGPISFGHGCNDVDYDFPSDAVALVVLEWRSPALVRGAPARPARFTPATLRVRPPPAIECFDGSGGSAQFRDHGRAFDAFVLLGRKAPHALVDRARAVLDTLRVTAR